MQVPSKEELDRAIELLRDAPASIDKQMRVAVGLSNHGIAVWGSIIGSAIDAPDPTNDGASAAIEAIKNCDASVRNAAGDGIVAGIQIGIAVAEARQTGNAVTPEITDESLTAAVKRLAADKLDEHPVSLMETYRSLSAGKALVALVAMAYGMYSGTGPNDMDKIAEMANTDQKTLWGLAVAVVIGLLAGVRIRPTESEPKPVPEAEELPAGKVRGGWK
jgi:hypothetical protein